MKMVYTNDARKISRVVKIIVFYTDCILEIENVVIV